MNRLISLIKEKYITEAGEQTGIKHPFGKPMTKKEAIERLASRIAKHPVDHIKGLKKALEKRYNLKHHPVKIMSDVVDKAHKMAKDRDETVANLVQKVAKSIKSVRPVKEAVERLKLKRPGMERSNFEKQKTKERDRELNNKKENREDSIGKRMENRDRIKPMKPQGLKL